MIDAPTARPTLPTGTVTFLRTDVEGSMAFARALGPRWDEINATHLELLQAAVERQGGVRGSNRRRRALRRLPGGRGRRAGGDRRSARARRASMARRRPGARPDGTPQRRSAPGRRRLRRLRGQSGRPDRRRRPRRPDRDVGGDAAPRRDVARRRSDGPRPWATCPARRAGARSGCSSSTFPVCRRHFHRCGRRDRPRATCRCGSRASSAASATRRELEALLEGNRLVTLTGPGWHRQDQPGHRARSRVAGSRAGRRVVRRARSDRRSGAWCAPRSPGASACSMGQIDRQQTASTTTSPIDRWSSSSTTSSTCSTAAGDVTAILRASPGTTGRRHEPRALAAAGRTGVPGPVARRPRREPGALHAAGPGRSTRLGPGRGPRHPRRDLLACSTGCRWVSSWRPRGSRCCRWRRSATVWRQACRSRAPGRVTFRSASERSESTIAWSHDLLAEREQRLLHDLAVFEGSFDVEQAAQVSGGDVLRGTGDARRTQPGHAGLATHRRRRPVPDAPDDRAFALDRLIEEGREPDIRRRHAEAYPGVAGRGRAAPARRRTGGLARATGRRSGQPAGRHALGDRERRGGACAAACRHGHGASGSSPGTSRRVASWRMPRPGNARRGGPDRRHASPRSRRAAGSRTGAATCRRRVRLYEAQRDLAIELGDKVGRG